LSARLSTRPPKTPLLLVDDDALIVLSHAARLLGINRTTLYSRIERLNHLRR
jgi:transcriptional regulator of acetoin/glycerol metabolism